MLKPFNVKTEVFAMQHFFWMIPDKQKLRFLSIKIIIR